MTTGRSIASGAPAEVQQLVLSLPEVDALCTRAARGAGYPWGISEECGHAMAWLASYGFDWAPVLVRRLSGERGGHVTPQPTTWTANVPICSLYCGSTLADFAALPEGPGVTGVTLGEIHDPLLALPFVAQVAKTLGATFDCYLKDTLWVNVADQSIKCFKPELNVVAMSRFELRLAANAERDHKLARANTTVVSMGDYAHLTEIALCMTVPTTAASEARAGGTEPDNE